MAWRKLQHDEMISVDLSSFFTLPIQKSLLKGISGTEDAWWAQNKTMITTEGTSGTI